MRNAIIKAYSLGIITGGFLTAGLAFAAGSAKADTDIPPSIIKTAIQDEPFICRELADDSSITNLKAILAAVSAVEHLDGYGSGEVVALAVTDGCAQYTPVLERFAAIYGPKGTTA